MLENKTDMADFEEQIEPKRFRFGLLHLFYATAVVAAAIALLGPWGICWALLVIAFWFLKFNENKKVGTPKTLDEINAAYPIKKGFTATELLIVIGIIVIIAFLLIPTVGRRSYGKMASKRAMSMNNARQLILAMHNYESANGHFPPAYVADEDGKPMYSWRVLILPYLDEGKVYEQYDFDEPWDGPNNSKLVDQLEYRTFFDPAIKDSDMECLTPYKLVTGPKTVFDADKTVGFAAIKAGSSNTIGLVEDSANPINWMSPVDLTVDEAVGVFDHEQNPNSMAHVTETKFSKTTRYYASLGILDGSVDVGGILDYPEDISPFFDIEDTTPRELDDLHFRFAGPFVEPKSEGYILVGINFLLAILPAFWVGKQ